MGRHEQLRALGAKVKMLPTGATKQEISSLEAKLGLALPPAYRSFLQSIGELRVDEWRFYGVKGALARNNTYAR